MSATQAVSGGSYAARELYPYYDKGYEDGYWGHLLHPERMARCPQVASVQRNAYIEGWIAGTEDRIEDGLMMY